MFDEVSALLRRAAAEAIMPRYRALAATDIVEKTAGEIVTIADREAEAIIARGLMDLRPGSRVVGEEACTADASLMANLGDGVVWLVDPLDGTGNFAAGDGPFAVMAALMADGDPVAAWMFDPVADVMITAEQGSGAFRNGTRIKAVGAPSTASALRGVVATKFMPPELQTAMKSRVSKLGAVASPMMMCAGTEYPDIAFGTRHFAAYWRSLPWDHAPGALFLTEAGGHVARTNGARFRVDEPGPGLLAARNRDVWHAAQEVLFPAFE